jgi:hypothetical protein
MAQDPTRQLLYVTGQGVRHDDGVHLRTVLGPRSGPQRQRSKH